VDSLQFQKAEFESPKAACALCQRAMAGRYFHLNGQMICPECAAKVQAGQQRPQNAWIVRGLLYGLGAAALCSAGYALFTYVTGFELALIAIVVGHVIGKAVRKGSNGLGGRRCQVLAVILTYGAITISYVPLIVKGIVDAQGKRSSTVAAGRTGGVSGASADGAQPSPVAPSSQQGSQTRPARQIGLMAALGMIAGISLISPFLALSDGFSGVITILIIGFGLMQAWKQTARDPRLLMGPYEMVGEQPLG